MSDLSPQSGSKADIDQIAVTNHDFYEYKLQSARSYFYLFA
jgi:hypothetical protein